jgi:hypothetical protein
VGSTRHAEAGLQIEGVLAYFAHVKHQKCIGDDVGDVRYVFTKTKTKNKISKQKIFGG